MLFGHKKSRKSGFKKAVGECKHQLSESNMPSKSGELK